MPAKKSCLGPARIVIRCGRADVQAFHGLTGDLGDEVEVLIEVQGLPQQLHLDVRVDDLEIADQRVRALGAVPLGERVVLEDEIYWVYADPAGHPFCLVQLETT